MTTPQTLEELIGKVLDVDDKAMLKAKELIIEIKGHESSQSDALRIAFNDGASEVGTPLAEALKRMYESMEVFTLMRSYCTDEFPDVTREQIIDMVVSISNVAIKQSNDILTKALEKR